MIIEVWKLPLDGERFLGEEPTAIIDLEPGSAIVIVGPIRYDLKAIAVGSELIVTGRTDAAADFRCSRCAERYRQNVAETAFESIQPIIDKHVPVDLTPEIREAIILAFPSYPVCVSTCRGLCAHCGANLNRGRCQCAPLVGDMRWSALDGLQWKQGGVNGRPKKKKVEK